MGMWRQRAKKKKKNKKPWQGISKPDEPQLILRHPLYSRRRREGEVLDKRNIFSDGGNHNGIVEKTKECKSVKGLRLHAGGVGKRKVKEENLKGQNHELRYRVKDLRTRRENY